MIEYRINFTLNKEVRQRTFTGLTTRESIKGREYKSNLVSKGTFVNMKDVNHCIEHHENKAKKQNVIILKIVLVTFDRVNGELIKLKEELLKDVSIV